MTSTDVAFGSTVGVRATIKATQATSVTHATRRVTPQIPWSELDQLTLPRPCVVGDYLQDQRRLDAERHLAYRSFLTAARELEDQAVRKTNTALQAHVKAIKDYQRDPNTNSAQLSAALAEESSAFDGVWDAWGALAEKYEDVRLEGSPTAIVEAGDVMDVALKRWNHLGHISDLLSGDQSRATLRVCIEIT
jgi:hypothetical protein